ncbi:putative polyketide synthase [Aspergillus violaceofuscus CBS 115571]|uniref:Putative polyketide synthase n=1 Tax=Aspergillus violaceofuscus (strain CBS 115571) TaxID=1450538 RepID=A0A2V5I4K9_ASPV1|nr:putative polyketide synthase [Aspergillus violaceofuscus CBS 115571]
MALRLPGGVRTTDDFWDMLINKKTGHCEIPGNRFSVNAFYSETQTHSVRTKHGYFLEEDPADFDPDFFSVPLREASRMDPQQRKLLEVVWECLESAGETNWRGKNIGCYVGVFGGDWLSLADRDPLATDRYYALETGDFALSNRISYEYDFRGPSMTLETGCSSSMMALHEACQALYSGLCSSAIVAGTNLILSPTMMTSMSENLVISPSGMCRSFDNAADGYGRGEAVNAIYVKVLSDAVKNHDPIRAVIRATATNSDGKTPNITTPGVHSQGSLIDTTYRRAGNISLSDTGYFECHGTGTQVGDAAEVSVIAELFGKKGITIGSVKPNVGHSEGASGITSIIKSVLSLEKKVIPPTICQSPHRDIPFEEGKLRLPSEPIPWPQNRQERISVNCFGIGGSNVHAIIDSYSSTAQASAEETTRTEDRAELLVLSASDEDSLQARIVSFTEFANKTTASLSDLAYTLRARRVHLPNRAFAIARPNDLIDASAFQKYTAQDRLTILAFSGQGAQWPGMGKALMTELADFRDSINEMDDILQSLPDGPDWALADEITNETNSHIHEVQVSQPLCTAFQIGLYHVLANLGLKAFYVVGHSSGEIAAAYVAGAITMRCAIILAYYRGVAAKVEQGRGSMFAVSLSSQEIGPYLREGVVIACINGPKSVTLSGDKDELEKTIQYIRQQRPEALCKLLTVDVAYHSHHMIRCGRFYESLIAPHLEHPSTHMLPLASSVTCSIIEDPIELGSSYWRRNLESPVVFQGAIEAILKKEPRQQVTLEVGPHPVLSAPLKQIWRDQASGQNHVYVPTILRSGKGAEIQLLETTGLLHCNGVPVNVGLGNSDANAKVVTELPLYPWARGKAQWQESRVVRDWRFNAAMHHELLGSRVSEMPELEPTWRNLLSLYSVPWICDHVLQGSVVFPAAGYIAMAGEAMHQLFPATEGFAIKNLILKAPWILEGSTTFEVITSFKPTMYSDMEDSEWYSMSVMVHDGTSWTKHCQGQVRPESAARQDAERPQTYPRSVESESWYDALNNRGLNYGPRFRGLREILADPLGLTAVASIVDDASEYDSRYFVHPTAIDHCLQLLSVAQSNGLMHRLPGLAVPASIGEIYVTHGERQMNVHAAINPSVFEKRLGDVNLCADGHVRLSMQNVFLFTLDDNGLYNDPAVPLVARMEWTKDIDFLPSDQLLIERAPMYCGDTAARVVRAMGKIAILYILNAADIVNSIEPCSGHMKKWKDHITSQARNVAEGKETIFAGSQDWVSIGVDKRKDLIRETLEDIKPIPREWTVLPTMLQRVYDNCEQFLLGMVSPLDVFFEDNILERYYAVTPPQQTRDFLYMLGKTNPGLRILEVGAGTGCATSEALRCLQTPDGVRLYSSYTFTDITPGFFATAADKFKDYGGLDFRTLDITKPPAEQGFELHSFDLVIASNVCFSPLRYLQALHVTPILQTSLKSVHDLLRPNGRLLLHELDPIFPGWWLGEEKDRQQRPYVSPDRWDIELKQAGFTGREAAVYDNQRPFHTNFTMLSRPVECKAIQRGSVHILRGGPESIWAHGLRRCLAQSGYSVTSGGMGEEHPSDALVVSLLDHNEPLLYKITDEAFGLLRDVLQNIGGGAILWLTHPSHLSCPDPRFGLVHGFARTMQQESDIPFTVFEIDSFDFKAYSHVLRLIEKMRQAKQLSCASIDQEYALHQGDVYVSRCHWPVNDIPTSPMDQKKNVCKKLDISAYGLLDTLHWCDTTNPSLGDDEVDVDVCYVGLNFRDLMVAMGLVGDRRSLGFEAAGVVRQVGSQVYGFQPGDRICFTQNGLFATRSVAHQRYCVKLPDGLDMEDAATMLSVYATALYSFLRVGALQTGQTVLIHSACGGVGQAAIHVCRALGAKIYATVGNEEKVQYLVDHFGFSRSNIFHSRDESFVADLMRETDGRGVDVVLNSLAGKLLHASWSCVAPFGKMIELGKRDFLTNGILDMAPFLANRAFVGVDMLELGQQDLNTWEWLTQKFKAWFEDGKIKPLHPIRTFEAAEVSSAFRYIQKGTHIGKILVKMPSSPDELPSVPAPSVYSFSPSSSYLLVGGRGGLGRSVSTWMVERGAREIVYLSPSAGQSESDHFFGEELRLQGCEAIFVSGNVAVLEDVQKAVTRCTKPLAGVMLLSMVLRDQTYSKMSYEDWTTCLDPKVQGAWNLHHAVQDQGLDFFVVFSSISAVNGFTGQANYAAANSFLSAFTKYRRQLGLASSILDLGPVEDVGTLRTNAKYLHTLRRNGIRMLNEQEVLQGLEIAISHSVNHGDDLVPEKLISNPAIVGLGSTKPITDPMIRTTWRREDPRFALYANMDLKGSQHEIEKNELRTIADAIQRDPSLADDPRTKSLIVLEMGRMILPQIASGDEAAQAQCESIKIDSLMAIEIKAWARRVLTLDISLVEIGKAATVGGLAVVALEHLKVRGEKG